MHNATEGCIIGTRPNDQRHHAYYPTTAISNTCTQSPSPAAAASTSPCYPAPLDLDNPFATGSDISAPPSPLSDDFDRPSYFSPPKSKTPFSEVSAPPSPLSVDFDRSGYFGGLGSDNPFASGSDVSAPQSPLSVNSDIPEDAAAARDLTCNINDAETCDCPTHRSSLISAGGDSSATGASLLRSEPSFPPSALPSRFLPSNCLPAPYHADTPTQHLNDGFSHSEDANHHPYLHQSGQSDVVGSSSNILRRRQHSMYHPPLPKNVLFDGSAIPATISPSHPLPQSLANLTALNHRVLALAEDGASPIRPGLFDSSGASPKPGNPRQRSDVTVETIKSNLAPYYHLSREIWPSSPFSRMPTDVPPRTVEVDTLTTATFERAANIAQVNSPGQIIQENTRAGPGSHRKATLSFADDLLQPVQNNTQDSSSPSGLFTRLWLETQQFPKMSIGEPYLPPVISRTRGSYNLHCQLEEILPELLGELVRPSKPLLRGGYADVYKGTWTQPHGEKVDVAIKVLRAITPTSITLNQERLKQKILIAITGWQRIKREALIWTRTIHRHIHPCLGYRVGDEPQLISPWCSHGNLSDYLTVNKDLTSRAKLLLIRQTALALTHLHNQRPPICHGDIKPENVLVNDFHEAALSDFGVSRIVEDITVRTGLTTTEQGPKGTYIYTAPEIFDPELLGPNYGGAKASCEGDVYAFGGLILTVMSGQPPFHKIKNKARIIILTVKNEHPKPCDHLGLPETDPLWSLMGKCWHFQPEMRPSMGEVVIQLEEEIARRER